MVPMMAVGGAGALFYFGPQFGLFDRFKSSNGFASTSQYSANFDQGAPPSFGAGATEMNSGPMTPAQSLFQQQAASPLMPMTPPVEASGAASL
jgi:hypothetical protein